MKLCFSTLLLFIALSCSGQSISPMLVIEPDTNSYSYDVSFWATSQDQLQSSVPSNVYSTNYDGFSTYKIVFSESQTGLTFTVFEADQWGTNAYLTGTNMTLNWPPPPPSNVCITVTCRGTGDVYQATTLQTPWVRTMTNVTGTVFSRTNPAALTQYWRGPGMMITQRRFN